MKTLIRIGLPCLFFGQLSLVSFAQSGIITTFAGPGLPVNGALATTQAIDMPKSVAKDGEGGFYVASAAQNRVYRVSANGLLKLVAGTSSPGFSGDGGLAISSRLSNPRGVAVDAAGNLFIADDYNQRIRKVTPSGVISTVAGNGTRGYSGDGGPATSAQLNGPWGVAIDAAGNLLIADGYNGRIRKVTPSGVISTVAGGGTSGLGDGGPATSAELGSLGSIALDAAGNLFIADRGNLRVRMVTPGGIISTVAGNGAAGYTGDGGPATSATIDPYGIAVDTAGNLFVSEYSNNSIRKVTPGGLISTVAGGGTSGLGDGGPATSAQLSHPWDVAVDAASNLLIADTDNNRIRKVVPGGVISTVAGNGTFGFSGDGGPAISAQLYYPAGVAVDPTGSLFIADYYNHRVRKVTPGGVISTVAGNGASGFSGDGGPATSAQLYKPRDVAVDAAGNLFIADWDNHRIRKVSPGGVIKTVAGNGTSGSSGDGGPATSAQLYNPSGVAVDTAGNLFIADLGNHRIRKVTPGGMMSTVAGNGTSGFSGDGGPATSAQLNYPNSVAVDASGTLFIVDRNNNRIRKVTPAGVISTVSAGLYSPSYVAVDAAGNLLVSDSDSSLIRKVTPGGLISTVAGYGGAGFSGDGGPATAAQLNYPWGVAVDPTGNLFITDFYNHRVRKVTGPSISMDLTLSVGGAATSITVGEAEALRAGYAVLTVNSGTAPYGTAVFSFKQNGVTVSEAAVPASPPTKSARICVDYRSNVAAMPGRSDAGTVDISTGLAVVNRGTAAANVTYTLRNRIGTPLTTGHGILASGAHFARFVNQLKEEAPDFDIPSDFPTAIQFGSLDVAGDQPLSVVALRLTINQRNEALLTSTPIADLTQQLGSLPLYFPQLVDGGGYLTTLLLLNTSSALETGRLALFGDNGTPLVVNQLYGTRDSTFSYSIQPGGVFIFETDGSPVDANAGSVQLIPDAGTLSPVGAGVFSYLQGGIRVTESGVPPASPTTHARIYIDQAANHGTGLAIASPGTSGVNVTLKAFQMDGSTPAGTSGGADLDGNGHTARFASQLISGLPADFTGVLDISSLSPFVALTLRSLNNSRGDFLLTTFPIADLTQPAPAPIVFPQIADGGGYITEFIFLSPGGASNMILSFYGEDGTPLAVGK